MRSLVLGSDHLVFLDALSAVLGQHGHQVGAVVSGSASLAESVRQQPDACVISLDATDRQCADLIQCMRTASPGTTILVVSADADQRAVLQALEAGAAGYLHESRGVLASGGAAGPLRALREPGGWLGRAPTESQWVPLRLRETCHDMRQPVAAVLALADAALTGPCLPDVTRSYLEQISALAQSLADVVHQWLRADEHADEGACLTDLVQLADEAVTAERVTFEGTLKLLPQAEPVLIRANPVDMRRVIANLLGNATRAAGSAGTVTIEVGCDSSLAQLAVEDSGPGLGRLPEGTRLGWGIVAQGLARCGGSIKYGESARGGVRACFWLPLAAQ